MATRTPILDSWRRPGELVQLADSRARLLGAVQQSAEELARLDAAIADLTRRRAEAAARHASLSSLAQAVAAQIQAQYPELDPEATKPVRRTMAAYGAYGNLIGSIRQALEDAGDEWLSTGAIAERIIVEYGLTFTTNKRKDAWRRTSIRNRLQRLVAQGDAECRKTAQRVYWRACRSNAKPPSLSQLRVRLAAD